VTVNKYTIDELEGWEDVEAIFFAMDPEREVDVAACYERNWLFVGTDGAHGSPRTIQDAREDGDDEQDMITVLVVQPRRCVMRYGHLPVDHDERLDWLETHLHGTLRGVLRHQAGSLGAYILELFSPEDGDVYPGGYEP
jgi:hypothetical protein